MQQKRTAWTDVLQSLPLTLLGARFIGTAGKNTSPEANLGAKKDRERTPKQSIWKHFIQSLPLTLLAMAFTAVGVWAAAGKTDSPAGPGSTASYTMEDVYQRLESGADGAQSAFTEPDVPPGTATMHSLNDIMAAAPAQDDADGAIAANVLAGKTFWGLTNGAWGTQTGSMPLGNSFSGGEGELSFDIPDGYYQGKTVTAADGDLKGENILPGVNIFGVDGSIPSQSDVTGGEGELSFDIPDGYYAGKTAAAQDSDLHAGNILQTANIFGVVGSIQVRNDLTGNDGELSFDIPDGYYEGKTVTATDTDLIAENIVYGATIFGVKGTFGARFTNNQDDTVTDTFTSLMWQQNANGETDKSWNAAVTFCENSVTGGYADWRLPTEDEMEDLTTGEQHVSAGEPNEFSNIDANYYWINSTDFFSGTTFYAFISMDDLVIGWIDNGALLYHPWCVRGN